MFDLSGKTALITGASGGLGAAIARTLHQAGAAVGLSGTREAALRQLAAELSKWSRYTEAVNLVLTAEGAR